MPSNLNFQAMADLSEIIIIVKLSDRYNTNAAVVSLIMACKVKNVRLW